MATLLKTIDKTPFAPVVAIAFGVVCAALVFALPDWRFSQIVTASGLPTLLSAARPPLGDTARALVAIALGLGITLTLWTVLSALGTIIKARRPQQRKAKGVRIEASAANADSANKAKRRPIFAERDLGAPFMSDEIVANMPLVVVTANEDELVLDTPIAPVSDDHAVPSNIDRQDKTTPIIDTAVNNHEPVTTAVPDAVLAAAPLPATKPVTDTKASEPSVSDLMLRLETALARRSFSAPRAGDIVSLRQALGAL